MNPTRLRECLEALGWSQRGLAEMLGLHETRVRRWARGSLEIPANVEAWLEKLARTHFSDPLPEGWKPPERDGSSPKMRIHAYKNGIDQPGETTDCYDPTEAVDATLEKQERFAGARDAVVLSFRGNCTDADRAETDRQIRNEGQHLEQV